MGTVTNGGLAGRRILVAEDEYFLADEMKRTLTRQGVEVVGPAATVGDGLRLLTEDTNLDFAIVDVRLRDHDSFAIPSALIERRIPFLFATGFGAAQIPPLYESFIHLRKPFVLDVLVKAIEAELSRVAAWSQS